MAEILELKNEEQKESNGLKALLNDFEKISGTERDFSLMDSIVSLLDLPDEHFDVLSTGIMEAFQRSVNNPNDKIALAQALNASGSKVEDLLIGFEGIKKQLEKIDNISTKKKDFIIEMASTICNAVMDTEGIAKKSILIPIELCHEDAKVPQYANISDSGMDVYALEDYTINPGETKLIPTGIKMALPPGYEIQARPKSGRALKTKLRIANTPGTIDAGYRDEIKIIIENIESPIKDINYEFDENGAITITGIEHGRPYYIGKGEKFAQLVLMEVPKAVLYTVDSVKGIGDDREGGFGSTGLK